MPSVTVPDTTTRTSHWRRFARGYRWFRARRILAALLAVAALVLALAQVSRDPLDPVEEPTSTVLVAATDLVAGLTIGRQDLRPARRTIAQLPDGALTPETDHVGRVLTGAVRRGEVITDRRLLGPGLSAGLGPGQVASPIRLVDLQVAALLRPGDRVDILAAQPDASTATVIAAQALVLAVPVADDEATRAGEPLGLVVLAVSHDTAARLAAAGASSQLMATLLPP